MTQSIFVDGIEGPAAVGVHDERGKGRGRGDRASRRNDRMRVGAPGVGVARRAPMPMVSGAGVVARMMRCMARMRVMAMAPVMMRLGGRAGEEKDGGQDQGRRRDANEPARSKATAKATFMQRHERPPD